VKDQRGPQMTFDGTPFVILSSVVLECQFGRDRKKTDKTKRKLARAKEVSSLKYQIAVLSQR